MESSDQDQLKKPPEQSVDVLERVGLYRQRRGLEPLRQDYMGELSAELTAHGRDPVEYVCGLFERHQVVFVGHQIPSRASAEFLTRLVTALPSCGVSHVAMEYLCRDDQQIIDAVTGSDAAVGLGEGSFARALMQELMLRWGLRHSFAFAEYLDVLEAIWQINTATADPTTDPTTGSRLRALALDYQLNFDAVTDTADLRSWGAWEHLRNRGSAARFISDVLLAEIIDGGHKALVICRTPHALTRRRRRAHRIWDAYDAQLESGRVVGAANHIFASIADRATTVLIHQPLPADGVLCDYALAGDGTLDAVFSMVDAPPTPLGFDTDLEALASLRCETSLDGGLLADLAQGWVYLEADHERRAPTPLLGAVGESTLAGARRLVLAGELRRADSTPADFDAAFCASATEAELSWTQIL